MYQGKQSFLVDTGADARTYKAKLYKKEGYKTQDKTLKNSNASPSLNGMEYSLACGIQDLGSHIEHY